MGTIVSVMFGGVMFGWGVPSVSGVVVVGIVVVAVVGWAMWRNRAGESNPHEVRATGRHVRLRHVRRRDIDAIREIYDDSTREANGWRESDVALLLRMVDEDRAAGLHVIELIDSGAVVGTISVAQRDDDPAVELGLAIATAHRGRGLMRDAVGTIIPELFAAGWAEVSAETAHDNVAAQQMLRSVGMTRVGERVRRLPNGSEVRLPRYALFAPAE